MIRVEIVRYEDGSWATYISTDTQLNNREILEAVADRWSIEESFHDLKEVWGGDQQQVRNIWFSIGCWNLIGWIHTLVDLHSRNQRFEAVISRVAQIIENLNDCKTLAVESCNFAPSKTFDVRRFRTESDL